jgi:hypothetical protein
MKDESYGVAKPSGSFMDDCEYLTSSFFSLCPLRLCGSLVFVYGYKATTIQLRPATKKAPHEARLSLWIT